MKNKWKTGFWILFTIIILLISFTIYQYQNNFEEVRSYRITTLFLNDSASMCRIRLNVANSENSFYKKNCNPYDIVNNIENRSP